MKTIRRRFIPLAASVAIIAQGAVPPYATAQSSNEYRVQVFTTENGLPSQAIGDFAETGDGFLWIEAGGMLARFDGYQFRTYTQANTPALARRITSLHAGLGDTLWILDEGNAVIAHSRGSFVEVVPPTSVILNRLAQHGNGTLYGIGFTFALGYQAIWQLARGRSAHVEVGPRLRSTSEFNVRPLRDGTGRVWIIDSALFLREIGATSRSTPPPSIQLALAPLVPSTSTGTVLTARFKGAFRELLGVDGKTVMAFTASPNAMPAVLDREQRLWVTAPDYFAVYERGRSEPVTFLRKTARGMVGDLIESAANGCVWVREIALLKVCRVPFRFVGLNNVRNFLQPGVGATALTWDSLGNVVVVDQRSAYTRLQPANELLRMARAIVDHRGNTWWSPASPALLSRIRSTQQPVRLLPHAGAYVFARSAREDSVVWYAEYSHLYRVVLPASGPARIADSLAVGGSVTGMSVASDGTLWATLKLNDFSSELIHVANGKARTHSTINGFPRAYLRAVLADDDGTIWIGTYGGGLYRFRNETFQSLTERSGLAENVVTSLLDDGAGNLWMGGNRSVHRVSRRNLSAVLDSGARQLNGVAYGRADGLEVPETAGFTGVTDSAGNFWFPTIAGAAVVNPKFALTLDSTPPRAHILDIRTERDTIETVTSGIHLTRGARRVVVNYTSTINRKSEDTRFEYRVDGIDQDWIDAGRVREAVYNNMSPGTHTFRVRAIDASGVTSLNDATIQFEVPPYFHETPAFILLVLAGTGVLAYGLLRYRDRHQRQRELELSLAVQERTAKLGTALETLAQQAEQLRTLDEAKSRFFANVSHEFRTPLSLIIGPVDDLRDGRSGELTPAVKMRLDGVQGNARRLLQLVEQLLDVARLESGTLYLSAEVRDLVPLLRRMSDSFASMAERRGIVFSLNCPVGGLRVRYDPDQMEKVISNLVSNALKFTPAGGTVELRATNDTESGGHAVVEIQDSGPGIAPEFHARVFERFFQIDDSSRRAHEGTGIGLALVRELVELHAGTVTLRSAPGKGSTFVVRLPLVVGNAITSAEYRVQLGTDKQPTPRPSSRPATRPVTPLPSTRGAMSPDMTTVLVVEDNAELLEYLREHLSDRYRVLVAANGVRGLEMAREHVPDLIVSDVMMPEMDGQALCEAVKADADIDFIPVILLTAKASRDSRLAGLAGGADDYLTKPVDLRELMVRADNLITSRRRVRERWRASNQQLPSISVPVHAPPRDASEQALLAALTKVLADHLGDEDFTVEKMAAAMGMARSTLYRRLEPLLGKSPLDALLEYRLAQAAQWLSETSITVSEVAYGVGFKSVPHFCRRFREAYDETPSAYRRAHAENVPT